ncbi:cupin-like domain-containing protein [Corallococcus praedator]|uniref:Cupin-like domain-containing protein n=1 Tax=Corallococcus praedator TaxID=2316724 RepID=A0ABX9QR54_9BACT|nr:MULTISPECIES: cupin-like domain-containing protein [Corallococcus]RKH35022.1 cupin-like domain-containing protein [Corallococcus sp. CA031C]RKI17306.1 cupin-like domain-containing protein [Corallococcus praedator]
MSTSAAMKRPEPQAPERIPMMSRQEFYASIGGLDKPVIFVDAMKDWPSTAKWTFDYFRDAHGDKEVTVEWLKYAHGDKTSVKRTGTVKKVKLREYVDALKARNEPEVGYLIGKDMYAVLPELLADLRFPNYASQKRLTEQLFFMGPKGSFTQLHLDRAHNLHAQIVGSKQWQLYSPARDAQLRPRKLDFVWSVVSEYDLVPGGGNPDVLPNGVAPDYDFTLEAGEILYVPYGWWHRVLTTEASISTNLWWWTYSMLGRIGPVLVPSLAKGFVKGLKKKSIRRGYYGDKG